MKQCNGVTSFGSGHGSVWLPCQLPDEKMEMIILQEAVHLPESFNFISQSQIMDKDVKVEPVTHYSLNLYNCHCKLIATAPQVDVRFVWNCILERAQESTKYTHIDDNSLLALKTTGHECWHDAEKRILWQYRLAQVGLRAVEIFPKVITDAPNKTGKCDCESCI
jgi:hypothetical protein